MFKLIGQTACALASLALVCFAPGCSLFAPYKEDVIIDSEPQGAQIIIPGQARLSTPATVKLRCDQNVTVIIKKDGYHTHVETLHRTLGKCGLLDVLGTVLVIFPAVGLFSPGAYTLEQHVVYAPLQKLDAGK